MFPSTNHQHHDCHTFSSIDSDAMEQKASVQKRMLSRKVEPRTISAIRTTTPVKAETCLPFPDEAKEDGISGGDDADGEDDKVDGGEVERQKENREVEEEDWKLVEVTEGKVGGVDDKEWEVVKKIIEIVRGVRGGTDEMTVLFVSSM